MQFAKKLIGDEEERAVSPVIGVILMVAITVILAAVIAAFVLDLGQSQNANVNAGISVDGDTVTLTDKGNADGVYFIDQSAATPSPIGDLTTVGEAHTISSSGTYSVVAYQGTDAANTDQTTTIQTIEV